MTARWLGLVVGSLACATLVTAGSQEAKACHNTVDRKVDPSIAGIQDAERLNEAGKSKEAIARVLTVDAKAWTREVGKTALGDRALIILARATVRTNGDVYPKQEGQPESHRAKAFEWAALTLRRNLALHKDSPVAQTDYAEALSQIGSEHAEARRILENAEARDVLSSAHGYAALARLRANADATTPSYLKAPLRALTEGKRKIDLLRCSEMTKVADVCTVTPSES